MTEQLVRRALARVFEREVTFVVRPDTPLDSFGPIDQAWVMLAQAITEAVAVTGVTIELDDADICEVQTFGELVQLVDTLTDADMQATS